MNQLLVISPHLDDAVLSCGQWLSLRPGALVVTVFAGIPEDYAGLTDWDAACGFASSQEAMRERRREDDAALAALGARARRLAFCDAQYGRPAAAEQIAHALSAVLDDAHPAVVALPLGLFHSDHVLARQAALLALQRRAVADTEVVAYEDVPYRRQPQAVAAALADLAAAGIGRGADFEHDDPRARERKRAALACYASQLRGLTMPGRPGHDDALQPERGWLLRPPRQAAAA